MGLGIFQKFFKKRPTSVKKKALVMRPAPSRYGGGRTAAPEFERGKFQGLEIPSEIPDDFPKASTKSASSKSKGGRDQRVYVTLTYPLIPKKPKVGEFVYAYAKIYFDNELQKYIYQVFEPPLTPNIK